MKIEEFYKILGLRGTVKILKYLNEHKKARYIDLSFIISYASLNTRLTQLETLNIIEHHFNRESLTSLTAVIFENNSSKF